MYTVPSEHAKDGIFCLSNCAKSSFYSRKCTLSVRKYRALFQLVKSTKIACLFLQKIFRKAKTKNCFFSVMFTDSNLFILHCNAFGLESVPVQINNTSLSLKANADVMEFQNVCL